MVQGTNAPILAAGHVGDAVHFGRLALGATEGAGRPPRFPRRARSPPSRCARRCGARRRHRRRRAAPGPARPSRPRRSGSAGRRRWCPPRGNRERRRRKEQPLGDEIEELLELLVGFAGKSRDERCAQGDVGHRGLDALDEGAKRCGIPSAVHGPKDRFAHVLQGNVQIRANVLAGRHDGEQLVGCALGLQVHDAEPRVGVRLGQRVDEPREVAAVGKVGRPSVRCPGR